MAKRFTDTDKWKKPFIRGLQGPYRLLWLYILDDCDHAGIWQIDLEVAGLRIGEILDLNVALQQFSEKILPFSNGEKWFIPAFIDFQYGELNPANRAHKSVLDLLKKYRLLDIQNKPLTSPLQGRKDMVKDKDLDMELDEGGVGETSPLPGDEFKEDVKKAIADEFGLNEIAHFRQIVEITLFVNVTFHRFGYQHVIDTITAYRKFKQLTGQHAHGFKGFIGTNDNDFADGGWNSDNWQFKIDNYRSVDQPKSKIKEIIEVSQKVVNPFRNE